MTRRRRRCGRRSRFGSRCRFDIGFILTLYHYCDSGRKYRAVIGIRYLIACADKSCARTNSGDCAVIGNSYSVALFDLEAHSVHSVFRKLFRAIILTVFNGTVFIFSILNLFVGIFEIDLRLLRFADRHRSGTYYVKSYRHSEALVRNCHLCAVNIARLVFSDNLYLSLCGCCRQGNSAGEVTAFVNGQLCAVCCNHTAGFGNALYLYRCMEVY